MHLLRFRGENEAKALCLPFLIFSSTEYSHGGIGFFLHCLISSFAGSKRRSIGHLTGTDRAHRLCVAAETSCSFVVSTVCPRGSL